MGAGFAGVACVRRLERKLEPGEAEISLVTPFSYQLYLPLLPQVASGVLTPQSVAVSLRRSRKHRTRIIPGGAIGVDPKAKICVIRKITGEIVDQPYDYIVLAPGSVTRTFDIPGLVDNARGMKTLAEAAYVRDHVIAQLDIADASPDEKERAGRLQFVVVGGGYAGTETAACLQRVTTGALRRYPGWTRSRSSGTSSTSPPSSCRNSATNSAPPPSTSCAGAGSRCRSGCRSPRPDPTR